MMVWVVNGTILMISYSEYGSIYIYRESERERQRVSYISNVLENDLATIGNHLRLHVRPC